jgi:hypothetical protein
MAGVFVRLVVDDGLFANGDGDHGGDTAAAAGYERDLAAGAGCVEYVGESFAEFADAQLI